MIIDEKGKLFGKINLLDLLIVVILIGVGFVVFYKMNNSNVINPFIQKDKITTVFVLDEVLEPVALSIKEGEPVTDRVTGALMGRVVSVQIDPSIAFEANDEGEMVKSSKEGYSSLKITVEGEGIYTETRVVFENNDYFINKSMEIRVGNTALYPRIEAITKAGE